MPKIQYTKRFWGVYKKLSSHMQKKVKKTISLLVENPAHPSLRSKPIKGVPGLYEASIDMNYRGTYERLPGDVLLLRVVDEHDKALGNP